MSFHGLFQIIVHDKFRSSVENQKDYQNVFTEHSKEETNMKMKKWIIYKNKEPFIQNKRLKEVEKISCWPVITPESWFLVESEVDFCKIIFTWYFTVPHVVHITCYNY